ncbi:SctK family type III secretion system sorting platform protein [Endozoicomonas arenosclerae]|uniref:SctK family type III secretion system sorting platform protein n=1 Tax=Endozoicomonas arenosclerae TaxID=1633495 RepID=UPI0007806C2A|nr:SctK family type III secretion system sorting platform protein [Endozoicomonas arenosclerae]
MNAEQPHLQEGHQLELFQSVAEFNLYLVRFIHHSWLKTIKLSPLVKQLRQAGNADYHLSHFLLKEFDLANDYDYDFDEKHKRIALADEEAILRLCLYLGIILNESVIRNTIKKQERLLLEQLLGEEAFRFAVKKAQFFSRIGSDLGPSFLIDWDHLDSFKNYLMQSGLQVLGRAFSESSPAFIKRLELKLPASCSNHIQKADKSALEIDQCKTLVVKTHKEVNRKWRHLLV